MIDILHILTPLNLHEEELKFFSSSDYHPSFEYVWNKEHIEVTSEHKYFDLIDALKTQDHRHIVTQAQRIFQTSIDQEIVKEAEVVLTERPHSLESEPQKELYEAFNEAFQFFNLDYKVVFSNKHGFNFRPHQSKKNLEISKYVNLQFFSVDGAVKHEMTHILRYENGAFNHVPRKKFYLPTEEGLASFMQDFHSRGENYSLFQHAAEYRASSIGLSGSLRDIVDFFISIGFTKTLAWQRAVRHKFGFVDTEKPGDIMKPAMYFYNEMKIKKLTTEEIIRLFVGKICVDDLPAIREYKGLIPAEKIVQFYSLEI